LIGQRRVLKTPLNKAPFDRKLIRITSLAFIIPSSIVVGYGIGYLLNWIFHREFFTILFIIIGIIAGFYDLVMEILKLNRELDGGKGD